MTRLTALLSLCACATQPGPVTVDGFTLTLRDDGAVDVAAPHGAWTALRLHTGPAHDDVLIEEQLGSFRFDPAPADTVARAATALVADGDGATLTLADGTTVAVTAEAGALLLTPAVDGATWTGLSAACDADETVVGLGSHAFDVVHTGEAFPLWTSEPGIGKSDRDEYPEDWLLTGTRHASSYPVPWLLRAQQPAGLLIQTHRRVEVDLCASNPDRLSARAWGPATFRLIDAATPLDAVRALNATTGRPALPPRWAFGPWADAVRGVDRVMQVAADLRAAEAPVSVIWTEDWKGANDTPTGYRLSEEWDLDPALYPDVEAIDADLEALGFKWFAYFAPFVGMTAQSGADASAAGALLRDQDGGDWTFTGVTFKPTGHLDPELGVDWAQGKMRAAREHGFDGWMADYGEWVGARTRVGADDALGLHEHNAFPARWQAMNVDVTADDAAIFCRSGWYDTTGLCPIVWVGDQRTSFDPDDGLPSVIPLALGLSLSGVPVVTHDVAGYQSVGNPPSTKELWMRWAGLGALSPIMRTHHGSFADQNWQFDSDAETLATFAELGRWHVKLFPYRYGLAAQAARDGTPMVLPLAAVFDGEPWERLDAWMLGPSLLVAPILEQGATSLDLDLPDGVAWFDLASGAPVADGPRAMPAGGLHGFVPSGAVIPLFDELPDSLADTAAPGLTGFTEADQARLVIVTGPDGQFVEADGTTYVVSGAPTATAQEVGTFSSGTLTVAGVTVTITGTVERRYTVEAWAGTP